MSEATDQLLAAVQRVTAEVQHLTEENAQLRQRKPVPLVPGVNLDGNTDFSTDAAFANVFARFTSLWGKPDKPWEPLFIFPPDQPPANPEGRPVTVAANKNFLVWAKVNADGYPLEDAGAFSYLHGYPPGDYRLSHAGSGAVSFGGRGQLVGADVMRLGAGESLATVKVTGINPADPPRDFRLMMP